MEIVFIGQFVSEEEALKNPGFSLAANNYQQKFIDITRPKLAISIVPIFIHKKISYNYIYEPVIFVHNYTSIRIKVLYLIYKTLLDNINVFILIKQSSIRHIWFYNLTKSNFLSILFLKFFSKKKLFVIIADYDSGNSLFTKLSNMLLKKIDGAIVLNSNITIIKNKQILPGILFAKDIIPPSKKTLSKNILFSGSLGETTGFEFVLEFFSKYPEYELFVSGSAYNYSEKEFENIINTYSVFSNIHFLGNLTYAKYLKVLDSCDIALSLRDSQDVQHDYNFPSKIMEYLSRNKIVISTKSYKDINESILFISERNERVLKNTLDKIFKLSMQELQALRTNIYNEMKQNFTEDALLKSVNKLITSN